MEESIVFIKNSDPNPNHKNVQLHLPDYTKNAIHTQIQKQGFVTITKANKEQIKMKSHDEHQKWESDQT